MAGFTKKVFIGASLAAGLSAVAATPAQALDITFHGAEHIQSYTHEDGNLWVDADASYLTDGQLETNVELWYDSENPLANVGFTATEGSHTVKVESVTDADWAVFADDWLDGLLATYAPLEAVWNELPSFLQNMLKAQLPSIGGGDPNIAEFSLDETGAVGIQMAGWNNLWDKFDAGKVQIEDPFAPLALAILREAVPTLQVSEIAKVTIDGQVRYAYSFDADPSGFVAKDDGMSYSGIYSWNDPGMVSVPEASTILGLIVVGGLIVASKRKSRKKA
jgi:hypothetical protein